jgi:hypothetical protein
MPRKIGDRVRRTTTGMPGTINGCPVMDKEKGFFRNPD